MEVRSPNQWTTREFLLFFHFWLLLLIKTSKSWIKNQVIDLQVVLVVKKLPVNAGDVRDVGLIPRLGRSPRGGNGNPLQYSCLENPMNRGVWWVSVHGDAKGQTQLKWLTTIDLRFMIRKMMLVLLTIPSMFFPACKALSIHFLLPLQPGRWVRSILFLLFHTETKTEVSEPVCLRTLSQERRRTQV